MALPQIQLTNAGAALLAKTPLGNTVEVTGWQIGSGALPQGADIRNQTALVQTVASVPIAQVSPDGNQCLITGQYSNQGAQAFTWEETGLFANDPDSGSILFAYGNSFGDGEPIPAGTETLREIVFGGQFVFDVVANITATIDQGLVFATVKQLQDYVPLTQKGEANGVASLDGSGKVPLAQISDAIARVSQLNKAGPAVVVGASGQGYTADDCDFLCDGTTDSATIAAAFEAIPGGTGTVLLLAGTYLLEKVLTVPSNCTLMGSGWNSILKVNYTNTESFEGVIYPAAGSTVANLTIDGNQKEFLTENKTMLGVRNTTGSILIYRCKFVDFDQGARVNPTGGYQGGSFNVICCLFDGTDNANENPVAVLTKGNSVIAFNEFKNITSGVPIASAGDIVVGNQITDCSNGIMASSFTGTSISDAKNIPVVIFGNRILNINNYGINLFDTLGAVVANNIVKCTSWPSSSKSIWAQTDAQHNLIIGNMIYGKNYTDAGTGNTWVNNKYN